MISQAKHPSTRAYAAIAFLAAAILLGGATTHAQDEPPLPVDPTPIAELLSQAELALINNAREPKKRVEIYLDVSDSHLDVALASIKNGDYRTSERELDIYKKSVAEATKVAFAQTKDKPKLAKKIEQRLYKQIRTLELVERHFPVERLAFAEAATRRARQLRVHALNETFATGEVLQDPTKEKKPDNDVTNKNSPSTSVGKPQEISFRQISFQQRPAQRMISKASFSSHRHALRVAPGQIPGDYLNEEEDNFVREAQNADDRVKVFMKIADRRLQALTGPTAIATDKKAQKKAEEEERKWGPLPKVSRAELMRHYTRAIEEVMAKLEDAYERNPKSSAIPKALTMLRDATERHLQILRSVEPDLKGDKEIDAFREAIDQAETANKGARDGLQTK